MEQEFIDILKKIFEQHGKEHFMDINKCKAIMSDYTGSSYLNERRLLLRAVESGVTNAIVAADINDIDNCMNAMRRRLQEEQFIDDSPARDIVNVIAFVLRGMAVKEKKIENNDSLQYQYVQNIKEKINEYKQNDVSREQNKIYKPGDRGPAGGIVFYDKGNNSNGWRYMEVSPNDVKSSHQNDGRAIWSLFNLTEFFYDENNVFRYRIFKTETGIGSGKKNTEQIIDVLKRESKRINSSLTGNAAQLCAQYILNGFYDWFLPSKDELNELYKTVKQYNLEGFSVYEHWSSTKTTEKNVWVQLFKDGTQTEAPHGYKKTVRAVRYF